MQRWRTPKRNIPRAISMLLQRAGSPQRRQLCRPNSILFMQKPSQKKCQDSRLLRLLLNYSSSREMYPDWSCFELRATFFTAAFFQLCIMRLQTELWLTTLLPTGTMCVNLYLFQLIIMQKHIHAKLSPQNALTANKPYPAAFIMFSHLIPQEILFFSFVFEILWRDCCKLCNLFLPLLYSVLQHSTSRHETA